MSTVIAPCFHKVERFLPCGLSDPRPNEQSLCRYDATRECVAVDDYTVWAGNLGDWTVVRFFATFAVWVEGKIPVRVMALRPTPESYVRGHRPDPYWLHPAFALLPIQGADPITPAWQQVGYVRFADLDDHHYVDAYTDAELAAARASAY